jgi:hypothetical protein
MSEIPPAPHSETPTADPTPVSSAAVPPPQPPQPAAAAANKGSPKDVVEYYQRQLKEQTAEVAAWCKALGFQRGWRSVLAYGFKLLALLGGVAVATGLEAAAAQAVGVAIAVAVILDGVFSNHTRLMAVAAAHRAVKQLLARVAHEHRISIGPVIEQKRSDEDAAASLLNDLNSRLVKELGEKRQEIQDRMDDVDLRALEALSLDEQRKAAKTV